MLALGASLVWNRNQLSRQSAWLLLKDASGWRLVREQQGYPVDCRFVFVASVLVVIKLRSPGWPRAQLLAFTKRGADGDNWRKLHVCAASARRSSGVTDDDVLGGKVDGYENRVPGNR